MAIYGVYPYDRKNNQFHTIGMARKAAYRIAKMQYYIDVFNESRATLDNPDGEWVGSAWMESDKTVVWLCDKGHYTLMSTGELGKKMLFKDLPSVRKRR